jgi:hypothetical protein
VQQYPPLPTNIEAAHYQTELLDRPDYVGGRDSIKKPRLKSGLSSKNKNASIKKARTNAAQAAHAVHAI